jgi:histidinol-phosphate/aromatic aminotransferase/cobyric acid decarboxylase-like protein
VLLERETLRAGLEASLLVDHVWPSDANFLLIDCHDADRFMHNSIAAGFIVRDVRAHAALPRSLRVSVGTGTDNAALLRAVGKP